jgi:hypothetical protein
MARLTSGPKPDSGPLRIALRKSDGWYQEDIDSLAQATLVVETVAFAMAVEGFAQADVLRMRQALEEAISRVFGPEPEAWTKRGRICWRIEPQRVLMEVEERAGTPAGAAEDTPPPEGLPRAFERGVLLRGSSLTWMRYTACGSQLSLCGNRVIH